MSRIVEVVPYNPEWPQQFAAEAARIKKALGANCVAVHHIGSTAVSGLAAKPLLDIMPVVDNILAVNTKALEELGYTSRGEMGMPFRRYFNKGGVPQHTHHLHIWEQGNPEIDKHLLFRDYLIAHPEVRDEYAELKTDLALKYKFMHREYTTSKDNFIKEIIVKSGFNGLTVVRALHASEWEAYHRIRKTEIFDRLPHIVYDPNHSSITDINNYHFLLMRGIVGVSIAQVEIINTQTAALRSLATEEKYKNQGYGSYMLDLMEKWVVHQDMSKMLMHAARRAENFYRKRGYVDMHFDDAGVNADNIDLGKILQDNHV